MPQPSSSSRFLGRALPCRCGRTHSTKMRLLDLSAGALSRLIDTLSALGIKKPFLFSDTNTYRAAGEQAAALLTGAHLPFTQHVLPCAAPVPNESTIGELLGAMPADCDAVIGIGSGTINDLGKFLAYKTGKLYVLIATAPSVDGFASDGAALTLRHLKVTLPAKAPAAIIGDPDILSRAPAVLIAAGAADILGKYTALADWRISAIINHEYHCEVIESMVRDAVLRVEAILPRLTARDPEAIAELTEALVLSGIAMAFAGNSRPASGCEHHLSHFWELHAHAQGRPAQPHGLTVGLGTIAALRMYASLRAEVPDFGHARKHTTQYDPLGWEQQMHAYFGPGAEAVIQLERRTQKNQPDTVLARLSRTEAHWDEIRAVIDALPTPESIESALLSLGAPSSPEPLSLDTQNVHDAVIAAKEIRERYTLLQLLYDLGRAKSAAADAAAFLTRPTPQKQAAMLRKARAILAKTRCFLLDMDGTLYLGGQLFPFSQAFLNAVEKSGRRAFFFTNNSSKSRTDYVKKLSAMGILAQPEQILTASHVLLAYLKAHHAGQRVYVVGTPALEAEFDAWGIPRDSEHPDIVVLGFDTTLTYDKLERACKWIRGGAVYYGVNPDFNCPMEGGHLLPDCGSMARLIEASTGRLPLFFGKPSPHALAFAAEVTGVSPSDLTMIGDRLYTDIALTHNTPASSVLVLTGEATAAEAAVSPTPPDLIIPSLETLTELLTETTVPSDNA